MMSNENQICKRNLMSKVEVRKRHNIILRKVKLNKKYIKKKTKLDEQQVTILKYGKII